MPHFTAPVTTEGLELLVMVGLPSHEMKALQAAGLPVPRPPVVAGSVDTGSNCCCISARVVSLLGLKPLGKTHTQTSGGTVLVNLYEVSLFLPVPGSTTEFVAVVDSWTVSDMSPAVTEVDALMGRDLLAQLLLFLNGPRNEFALAG
jgi:hypothetical protein